MPSPRPLPPGRALELASWPRAAAYRFFRGFDQPFFTVVAPVDVAPTLAWCREQGASFSLACWYCCLGAVNAVEALRYRLRPEGVWVHEAIDVSSTVLLPDETFRFCTFPRRETFAAFAAEARAAMAALEASDQPLERESEPTRDDLIHGTVLPWVAFTSISHARAGDPLDSVPKIAFGKYEARGARVEMPVAVEAHHALADGLHVGRFFAELSDRLARPAEVLPG